MDESVHNEDLLIRYLDGEISAGEKAAVEQRLKTDAAFRQQYENLQVALQAIKQLGATQHVAGIHQQMMQELRSEQPTAKVFSMKKAVRYTMAVAASVLVLFIGVRLYFNSQVSPDRIYNETFVDFNVANTRGVGAGPSKIETFYQQQNYAAVTTTGRTLQLSGKDSLLIGLSYLHAENYSSAINWFDALANTQSDYRQDAEFYLSLSHLKAKNYAQALAYMEGIYKNPAHLYHEQVSEDAIKKLRRLADK